jgi:hypothetical protein
MGDDTCTTLRHIGVELIHIWEMIKILTMHNNDITPRHIGVGLIHIWEMIKILTMHNNDITPRHIGVGLIHWVSPQCVLVLYVHNSKTHWGAIRTCESPLMYLEVVHLLCMYHCPIYIYL